MKKSINIISRLRPLGGAQSVCLDHIDFQLKNNIKPILISGNYGITFSKKAKAVRKKELKFLISFNPFLWIVGIVSLTKIIKQEKPDFIITHSTVAGIVGRILGFFFSIKTVHTFHGFNTTRKPFFGFLFIILQKLLSNFTTVAIFVCSHDYNFAKNKNFLAKQNHILFNTINKQTVTKQPKTNKDSIRFVMVARHAEQKDHFSLFKSLKIIENLNFKVDLIGGGELVNYHKTIIKKMKLENKVNFLGEIKNVIGLLPNYDCGLLITKMEGLPVSILEYLASHLIVICSDVGGCRELVTHNKNGFLLKNNDPKKLSAIMKKIIEKKVNINVMKKNSYKHFLNNFTKDIFFENLKNLKIYE